MAPAIFKNMVFATAGPLPGQFTEENLAMWTKQRKGQFTKDMDESVTHLLCTDEHYKARNKNKRIKEAQQKGRRIRVVHYDWFDFSCNRDRKLPEKEYYFDTILAEERAKRRKQLAKAKTQKNLALGEHWINPELFRVFADVFPFEYQVELFRTFTDNFGTCEEKYILYLFQSFAKPVLYWFGVKYYKKDDSKRWLLKAINRPSPCSRPFAIEFKKFKDFFKLKTGIAWHERISKAGTTEETYFQYTPPIGGKPVGKGLTKGKTYEDCLAVNRQLRQTHHELFGDAFPDISAVEGSECQDRDKGVEQNNNNPNDAMDESTMNQDVAEQEMLKLFKDKAIDKSIDTTLPSTPEQQHMQKNTRNGNSDVVPGVAEPIGTLSVEPEQDWFGEFIIINRVSSNESEQPTKDTATTFNQIPTVQVSNVAQAHSNIGSPTLYPIQVDENVDQTLANTASSVVGVGLDVHHQADKTSFPDKSEAIGVLLNAANASQEVRSILKSTQFDRIVGEPNGSLATEQQTRTLPEAPESVRSNEAVDPECLETPTDDVEQAPIGPLKLQPSDRARIREAFDQMTWSQKRKRDIADGAAAAFRTPDGANAFMGAGEVGVVNKRIKQSMRQKPDARQITKTMRDTANREMMQQGNKRPLSEEQVAHIFSQQIPQSCTSVAIGKDLVMDLSINEISDMVDEMYGDSRYDDGGDFMTEVHGDRPWPDDHDLARPEDDPAHTNDTVEDFDTRISSYRAMSARPTTAGSSGPELDCDTDNKAGEQSSDTSMALSDSEVEVSGKVETAPQEAVNVAMQDHIAAADEPNNHTQGCDQFPLTYAQFAPFTEEDSMFRSAGLRPDMKASLEPKME
ncbi:hypothetical protein ACHAQH_001777 [Verticillium albo-atrum]